MLATFIAPQFSPGIDPLIVGAAVAAALVVGVVLGAVVARRSGRVARALFALPPLLLAVLPGQAAIGVIAAVAAVVLIAAIGGSLGASFSAMPSDSDPHLARATGWAAFCSVAGVAAGVLAGGALASVDPAGTWREWAWRLPFALAGVVLLATVQWSHRRDVAPAPPSPSRSDRFALVGLAAPAVASLSTLAYGLPLHGGAILGHVLPLLALVPFGGWLSDLIGRRKSVLAASALLVLFTIPAFALTGRGDLPGAIEGWLLLAAPAALALGSVFAAQAEFAEGSAVPLAVAVVVFGIGAVVLGSVLYPVIGAWADEIPLLAAALVGLISATLVRERRVALVAS